MSYATILIPGSGIASAYENTVEFKNAVAIYLLVWCLVTFLFL
jgi:succinate-acetate transporter protein